MSQNYAARHSAAFFSVMLFFILFGSNIFLKAPRSICLVCVLPSVRGTKLHVVILCAFICALAADQHSERMVTTVLRIKP